MLKGVSSVCSRMDTSPDICALLIYGIESEFNDTHCTTEGIPPEIADLAAEQNHLGWHQILLGRFSLKWELAQREYLESQDIEFTRYNHGTQWQRKLITCIWEAMRQLWTIRNEDRHGKDEETRLACRYRHTQEETKWLYDLKEQCCPEHRDLLFYSDLGEHNQKLTTEKMMRDWIYRSKSAILSSADQYCERSTNRRKLDTLADRRRKARGHRRRNRQRGPPQPWRGPSVDSDSEQTEERQMRNSMRRWLQPGRTEQVAATTATERVQHRTVSSGSSEEESESEDERNVMVSIDRRRPKVKLKAGRER